MGTSRKPDPIVDRKSKHTLAVQGLGQRHGRLIQLLQGALEHRRVVRHRDQSVRLFLASQDGGRKGGLSRFIEQAVRTYIFECAVEEAKGGTPT